MLNHIEMNREWLRFHDCDEPYGERNFTIPLEFVIEMYKQHFNTRYSDFENFMDWYVPEEDGELIYREALKRDLVMEERLCFDGENGEKFINGDRRFTKDDFHFEDEVSQTDNILNYYIVWDCNVDEVLGTNVENSANSDYVNVYVFFDLDTGTVNDELHIHLCKENGEDVYYYYHMNDEENSIVRNKIDEYMLKNKDEHIESCPYCPQIMWYQALLYKDTKWICECPKCGKSYGKLPPNYNLILQKLFDYSRIMRINLNSQYSTVAFKCRTNQNHYNTVASCNNCEKVGCHIATAASDAELIINNEKDFKDLSPYWTSPQNHFHSQDEVAKIKAKYPIGTKIKIISMFDEFSPVPIGSIGEVITIDSIGTLHTKWNDGRSLGVIVGMDEFEVIDNANQGVNL